MGHYAISGIINLNKPPEKTSFQMVAAIRKLTGVRKVGHSGTLDPDATGVLPILIGRATRLASFLTNTSKTYRAEIKFGRATDTYDSSGDTTHEGDVSSLSIEIIEAALDQFRGTIEQVPPMYSAIKHQGKPLYHLARAGIEIERKPRQINISRFEIIDWHPPLLTVEVECSKGTYIRSLAHDLGQTLNCGAHLYNLVRTQTGPFHIGQSVTIDELAESSIGSFVLPPDAILTYMPSITIDSTGKDNIACGRPIKNEMTSAENEEYCRTYDEDGQFLALVRFNEETGLWHPKMVFFDKDS